MSRRSALILLILVQAALLYATSSALASQGVLYGCSVFCGRAGQYVIIPTIAALFGVAMFALPSLIGALCNSWQGAIALALAPWWLVVIAHAGTLLRPYIGLGGNGGRFDSPFWLDVSRVTLLLLSFALFAVLGWVGWLIRQALRAELAPAA